MNHLRKLAVVTGTSTGIGLATSVHLARRGYHVFAGMRNLSKSDALREAAKGLPLDVIELDVTSQGSIDEALTAIRPKGPIDVLVNNAGIGAAAPLELTPLEEHQAIFETNYFGAIRCIQAVLPEMRERQTGCIVNNTSMEGLFAMPNQIPYSASKWALECAGEALAHEVARFGVRVVNVAPGIIMTNIFENSEPMTRFDKTSPYVHVMRRNGKMFASGFRVGTPPEPVAETICEAIESPDYKLRWLVGEDAKSLVEGRRSIPDEEWVRMGSIESEEEYNKLYSEYFGVEL